MDTEFKTLGLKVPVPASSYQRYRYNTRHRTRARALLCPNDAEKMPQVSPIDADDEKNTFAKKDEPGFEQMKKNNFLAKKSAII